MKKILVLVTVLIMGLANLCFASNGTLLDNEEKTATQVLSAIAGKAEYTEIRPGFSAGLAKNLTSAKFVEMKKAIGDKIGSISNAKLLVLQKFDNADSLIFIGKGSKSPNVEIRFVFETSGRKPLLNEITMRPVEIKKQAAQTAPAQK